MLHPSRAFTQRSMGHFYFHVYNRKMSTVASEARLDVESD